MSRQYKIQKFVKYKTDKIIIKLYTVKSFISVGLKFRGFEFNNEFVDI